MSKYRRYIIITTVFGLFTWLLIPTTDRGVIKPKEKSIRNTTHNYNISDANLIREGISDSIYILPYEMMLTSAYSYSIIDSYWSKYTSNLFVRTAYVDGKPYVTYDKDCIEDVYRRIGYISEKIMFICKDLQVEIGDFLPKIIDKCYYDIAIPLANDSYAYSGGSYIIDVDGEYETFNSPSINIEPCKFYYSDSPFNKNMNKKYSNTIQHVDVYKYRDRKYK